MSLAPRYHAPAFVFGSSEPQQFMLLDEVRVLAIPTVTVCFCEVEVPSLLGITSVQSSSEHIVPMRDLKMGWVPWLGRMGEAKSRQRRRFVKKGDSGAGTEDPGLDGRVYVLHCSLRVSQARIEM